MADTDLIALVEALTQSRVLCVGDVMLDHFVYGRVERVSPEAPIPVLRVEREIRKLGGAGNVLSNLHALGAQGCFVSVTGGDPAGREVSSWWPSSPASRRMCWRARPHDDDQDPLHRRDAADAARRSRAGGAAWGGLREDFRRMVEEVLPHYQVTVLSDYAKGVLSRRRRGRADRRGESRPATASWSTPRARITASIAAPAC